MLSFCRAFIVAQTPAQNRSLINLADRAGFGLIGTVLGERRVAIEAARREIAFFLVHHQIPDAAKLAVLERIRQSSDDAIRYAPVCLIINDCPFETVLKYVEFGFDDIVTLPERRDALVGRLLGQLDTPHIYIETTDYLGPDRRRMEVATHHRDERRRGDEGFLRLTVHRSVEGGVRIVRRELVGRQTRSVFDPIRQRAIGDAPLAVRA
jgi:CheY-like chemotaxis protein